MCATGPLTQHGLIGFVFFCLEVVPANMTQDVLIQNMFFVELIDFCWVKVMIYIFFLIGMLQKSPKITWGSFCSLSSGIFLHKTPLKTPINQRRHLFLSLGPFCCTRKHLGFFLNPPKKEHQTKEGPNLKGASVRWWLSSSALIRRWPRPWKRSNPMPRPVQWGGAFLGLWREGGF